VSAGDYSFSDIQDAFLDWVTGDEEHDEYKDWGAAREIWDILLARRDAQIRDVTIYECAGVAMRSRDRVVASDIWATAKETRANIAERIRSLAEGEGR
jgi:hypothetical protein